MAALIAPAAAAASAGLNEADFRLTAPNGFGDGWNSYAHCMAVFEGRVYVGTTRGVIAMHKWNLPSPDLRPWPVKSPEYIYDVPRQAEIWCYDPALEQWERVYQAPLVPGRQGGQVPRYIGFRGIAVFQGPGDARPCLYVSTWAPQQAEPPDILRSEDGRRFVSASRPPFSPAVRSFRTLQVFQGRVHTTPTSSVAGARRSTDSIGSDSTVYATTDLASGEWVACNEEGFGSPANVSIFEMVEYQGHLYAATVNPKTGFELWKTPGGTPPYRWTCVLRHGAGRGVHNEVGVSLCEYRGALYVGTGVLNGGYHRVLNIGPAAAEILRVWPDDSWELLMGDGRHTEQGLRYPLSGYSAGFDALFNGYVWRMAEHEGWLYAGTFNWGQALPFVPTHLWPPDVLALLDRWGRAHLNRYFGGAEIWRTQDGLLWQPVTRNAFGNKYNWGIRNFASTPQGLFVGTANPYGPTIAQQQPDGRWSYVDNPRGGCEVWLGRPRPANAT